MVKSQTNEAFNGMVEWSDGFRVAGRIELLTIPHDKVRWSSSSLPLVQRYHINFYLVTNRADPSSTLLSSMFQLSRISLVS